MRDRSKNSGVVEKRSNLTNENNVLVAITSETYLSILRALDKGVVEFIIVI